MPIGKFGNMENREITLQLCSASCEKALSLPYADGGIKAGFPSPAQDYLTCSIDLNKELIRHAESTFYARVDGHSLMDAGIDDGDLVVIDKGLDAQSGDYVAAFIDGDFTLKRFETDEANNCAWLMPANKAFNPIRITTDNNFMVWGVITYCIKKFKV